jgi:hypothetical protein
MKLHLGGGNFRTYALHLNKWDGNLRYKINVQSFTIICKQSLERPFVELVEQAFWEYFLPAFGKKSGL